MNLLKTGFCLLGAALALGSAKADDRMALNGAGASFPAPVYSVWTYKYSAAKLGAAVNYQSVGSGAGVNQIKAGTVDFAGTDSPVSEADCQSSGLIQLPMLKGAVVPIVNLPKVKSGALKLSNEVLADLFMGKITRWDDERIAALNPGLALPKLKVTVIHRSDSSGTTFVFTSYLAKVSKSWENEVGAGASVKWPVGLGGQKNPGVCNSVAKVKGSIGYTEYTYALEAKLSTVQLPSSTSSDIVAPESSSWPILGTTYLLLRKDTAAAKMDELKKYIRWCFTDGAADAVRLHYQPLPEAVVKSLMDGCLK